MESDAVVLQVLKILVAAFDHRDHPIVELRLAQGADWSGGVERGAIVSPLIGGHGHILLLERQRLLGYFYYDAAQGRLGIKYIGRTLYHLIGVDKDIVFVGSAVGQAI